MICCPQRNAVVMGSGKSTKVALLAGAASVASAGVVRNFPPLATPPRRWLGSENGPVLGGAPGGLLVSRTIVEVRVPSRLSTSVMVPRGALHEIMPPRWPHTPRNLHTPPARRCISALCHRPELRRAHADVAVG